MDNNQCTISISMDHLYINGISISMGNLYQWVKYFRCVFKNSLCMVYMGYEGNRNWVCRFVLPTETLNNCIGISYSYSNFA